MLLAFRKLADDTREIPRAVLFDPPLENLIRTIARQIDHPLNADASWILAYIDMDE